MATVSKPGGVASRPTPAGKSTDTASVTGAEALAYVSKALLGCTVDVTVREACAHVGEQGPVAARCVARL